MTAWQYFLVAITAVGVWALWVLVDVVFDGSAKADAANVEGKDTKPKGKAK